MNTNNLNAFKLFSLLNFIHYSEIVILLLIEQMQILQIFLLNNGLTCTVMFTLLLNFSIHVMFN